MKWKHHEKSTHNTQHTRTHKHARATKWQGVPFAFDLSESFVGEGASEVLVQPLFGVWIQFTFEHRLKRATERMSPKAPT